MPNSDLFKRLLTKKFFGNTIILYFSFSITEHLISHFNLIKPEEELSLKDWVLSLSSTFLLYGILLFLIHLIYRMIKSRKQQHL